MNQIVQIVDEIPSTKFIFSRQNDKVVSIEYIVDHEEVIDSPSSLHVELTGNIVCGMFDLDYETLVKNTILTKYKLDEEISIMRKSPDDPEYIEHENFVKKVKEFVSAYLGL